MQVVKDWELHKVQSKIVRHRVVIDKKNLLLIKFYYPN